MDPVSAFGVAAAATQLAGQAKDIVSSMWNYYEAVKKAPKNSRELRQEMGVLADLLSSLEETVGAPSAMGELPTSVSLAVNEFSDTLNELKARVAEPQTKGVVKRLKWPFKQDENSNYLSKIERYKGMFTMALSIQAAY
jgi:hypothetical protein